MTREDQQARRYAALRKRYVGYAIKFALDSEGAAPTDANLKRILDRCVRPARPAEYARIRQYVNAYRADRDALLST